MLRTVERELLDDTAAEPPPHWLDLGFPDERELSAAIRRGDLDDRGPELLPACGRSVRHRLAVAHPGYEHE